MRKPPAWVRDERERLEVVEGKKMRDEVATDRLHGRVVGALPLDREHAHFELTEEQRALRSARLRVVVADDGGVT